MRQAKPEIEFILVFICITFVLVLFVLFLFALFQKKKNTFLLEQKEAQKQFENEIAESQVEIREQTLRNISWELHDNIGQLLTLAKIQLQSLNDISDNATDLNTNLTNILNEVRALSRIINPDYISNINLEEAIQLEISRFNRLNYIHSTLTITGETYPIDKKHEIIIFRILQEFFSNTIKHSKAHNLTIQMKFSPKILYIEATDDGVGFDVLAQPNSGLGLENMKRRAKLAQCDLELISEKNKGTTIKINYKNHDEK